MEKEQKEALLKEITDQVKTIIADSQKENVKKTDLEAKIEKLNNDIAEKLDDEGRKELKENVDKLAKSIEELTNVAKEQGMTLKKIQENGITEKKPKSFREAVKAAILEHKDKVLKEKNDDNGQRLSMKDYFEAGNKVSPTFTIKEAVDMLQSSIVQNQTNLVRLTELDPQRVGIPLTLYPHVFDYIPSKTISKANMSLLVVYSYEDGAATKTEGSASGKSSFLFKTVEFKAFYIATHFILSDETLDDLEEALDEISIVAPDKIMSKIDGYVLGSAGDDASAIAGILSANKHTAFDATPYAGKVPNANIIDVIAKAKLDIEGDGYMPNAVLLNPADVDNLAALKNAMDDSVQDRRVVFGANGEPVRVCGLAIIKSTAVTADQGIVLDLAQAMIGRRKDMTMEIGYNGTDLTEGQKTVVIKVRLAFGVRDKAAVRHIASIAADVAELSQSA